MFSFRRHSFSVCLLLVIFCHNGAQSQTLQFTSLENEPGLQGKGTVSLLQDSEGYLWVGTISGLARYDGVAFKFYTHNSSDSTSLIDNFLGYDSICEDSDGNIWVGTRNGLSRWNRSNDSFTRFYATNDSTGLSHNGLHKLHMATDSTLWISTLGGGVNRYDPDTGLFTHYMRSAEDRYTVQSDTVLGITEDVSGKIWAISRKGISWYDDSQDRFERLPLPPGISTKYPFITIQAGLDSTLWIGSFDGLLRYNLLDNSFDRIPSEGSNPVVTTIYQEASGALWIGSNENGLYTYHPGEGSTLTQVPSFDSYSSDDRVMDILLDQSGVMWVATWSGLKKGVSDPFREYRQSEFDGNTMDMLTAQTFYESEDNMLWIGFRQGGLARMDLETKKIISISADPSHPLSAISNGVYSIIRDSEGLLWFGTSGGGVYVYNEETNDLHHYEHNPDDDYSLSDNQVYTVYEDARGDIWVGTATGGLNKFDRDSEQFMRLIKVEDDERSLSANSIWPMLEDQQGRFWVGTFGGGLNRLYASDGMVDRYLVDGQPGAISENRVVSIYEASDGMLWIGTMGGGVNRFDPEIDAFEHWTMEDGLPSNNIVCILEDEYGKLWMGSDEGLIQFDPRAGELVVYNSHHGITYPIFAYGGCYKSSDGTLFFGTIRGFISFKAGDIDKGDAPPTVITALQALDEEVPIERSTNGGDVVRLSYTENFIDIHFAALDFKAPGMNKFRFFLDGYEDGWSKATTEAKTRYTKLDPGDYTFYVQGSNGYGAWNEEAASLLVSVASPFWKTWWFYALCVLSVCMLGFTFYKVRRDRKREVAATKRRIANDLHDDLGSRLAALGLKLESTSRVEDREEQTKRLTILAARTREIIQDLREITKLVEDKGEGRISEIIRVLRRLTLDLLPDNVIVHKDFPDSVRAYYVSMLWKHNIVLFFSETLCNISRHAEASEVFITARLDEDYFVLRVKDNGSGFNPKSYEAGKGIISMENRAKRLNGNFSINSTKGQGTTVELRAPVKKRKQIWQN